MSLPRYLKSKSLVLSFASDQIEKYEKEILEHGYYTLSCKNDLLKRIKDEIESYKDDFSKSDYSSSDLFEIASRMVCTNSFELIEGNLYRVGGHVNWTGPAKNAMQLHQLAIKNAVERGWCTEEDAEEDSLALRDAIRRVL